MTKSPLPYVGGKWTCLPIILERFPQVKFTKYVEPFGGGASVLLSNDNGHANKEIYNDLDADVYNFFHVVKYKTLQFCKEMGWLHHVSPEEFKLLLGIMHGNPVLEGYVEAEATVAREFFSGEQLDELLKILNDKFTYTDVQRACALFKLKKLSYASGGKSYTATPFSMQTGIREIAKMGNRLENVGLENRDFRKVFKTHDNPDAFTYADPPYYGTEKQYSKIFSANDHYDLADIFCNLQGYGLLSYNDCDFVRDLYPETKFFWHRFERADVIQLKHNKNKKFKEILIANYDMEAARLSRNTQISLLDFNEEGVNIL